MVPTVLLFEQVLTMAIEPDQLKEEIQNLSEDELQEFREWFARFDDEVWIDQWEDDVKSGALDDLGDQAIEEHEKGNTSQVQTGQGH
jgi:hypothetical protein